MKKFIITITLYLTLIIIGALFVFQFLKYKQFVAFLTGFPIFVIGLILFISNLNRLIKYKEMSNNDGNNTDIS